VNRFERWSVWSTSVATTVTGVIYLWMKYLLVSDDPLAVVNHPLQPLVLKLHILVAPLLVFALGLVTVRHVWRPLRDGGKEGRRTGLLTFLSVAPMVATGYLIQAITHEGWLRAMALSHIGLGLLYGAVFAAHQVATRGARDAVGRARARHARRRQRRARSRAPTPRDS